MKKLMLTIMGVAIMAMTEAAPVENAELMAINIIAKFEGFRPTPYTCPGGHLTIGYGFADPEIVARGKITRQEADKILGKMVRQQLAFLNQKLPNLTVRQQAAAVSFIHNFGRQGFLDSTYYKRLKEGNIDLAKKELARWVHVKQWDKRMGKYVTSVAPGLVKRREYEARYL